MNVVSLRQDEPTPTPPAADEPATFPDWWVLYPRHVKRKDAEKAWGRLDDEQRLAALVGAANQRPMWNWQASQREDWLDFIPYPATWIRAEQWEDEIPERFRSRTGNGNGSAACQAGSGEAVADSGPRIIPEHVKALIAKIKAQGR